MEGDANHLIGRTVVDIKAIYHGDWGHQSEYGGTDGDLMLLLDDGSIVTINAYGWEADGVMVYVTHPAKESE